jgi:hypothetical protein
LVIEPDSESIALKVLLEKGIPDLLKEYGKDIALQGELIGPGIQMNIYGLKEYQWRVPSFHPFHSSPHHFATSPPLPHNIYAMQSLHHAIFTPQSLHHAIFTPRNLYATQSLRHTIFTPFYPLLVVQNDFPLNY